MKRLIPLAALVLVSPTAFAQMDFTGEWQPAYHEDAADRIPGPEIGDYMGLPLNDAARARADAFDADRLSMVMQYQCRPHSSDYGMRGLGNLRITKKISTDNQKLIAFETYMPAWGSVRTVWLDGRPHPPAYAEHTFQGFSTGVWDGNQLTITTTHLKENYHRRNEVPAAISAPSPSIGFVTATSSRSSRSSTTRCSSPSRSCAAKTGSSIPASKCRSSTAST